MKLKKIKKVEYYLKTKKFINKFNNIMVISKGGKYDFRHEEQLKDTLYIGIKQSIYLLPRKDILVLNDYEGLFGLEDIISEIKIIICPYIIHYKHKKTIDSNFKFIKYLKHYNFKGKIINYRRSLDHPDHLIYYQSFDSGCVIFKILEKLDINKLVKVYGLYKDINDNPIITKIIKNAKINFEFNEDYKSYLIRIISIKKDINIENMNRSCGYYSNNIDKNFEKLRSMILYHKIIWH